MKDCRSYSDGAGSDANFPEPGSSLVVQTAAHGAVCPACERFVGAALRCPYCGQAARNASFLRLLRLSALLLAVSGLFFIYFAPRKEAPLVEAASITPMMNFARVRIRGRLKRDPYLSRENGTVGYISFGLESGDRRVRVKAYRDNAAELALAADLPEAGDTVEVEGNLRISDSGNLDLVLRSAGDVRLLKQLSGE